MQFQGGDDRKHDCAKQPTGMSCGVASSTGKPAKILLMSTPINRPDEVPQPPSEPDPLSCCGSNCGDACVWTLYSLEQKRYQAELLAWQARQQSAQ